MPQYSLYNAVLTTDRPMTNLDRREDDGTPWPLAVTLAGDTPSPASWTNGPWEDYPARASLPTFQVWSAPAAAGTAFRLGYYNPSYCADFTIRADRQAIWATWKPTLLDDATTFTLVCRLLAGPVTPFVLRLAGQLALHGAVVASGRAAVAFIGASGAGKSTLAATCAQRGWPTLADDVVVLTMEQGVFYAQPGPPNRHLWPETLTALEEDSAQHPLVHPGTAKRHVECATPTAPRWAAFMHKALPLRAIFLLEPFVAATAATRIEPVSSALALPLLLRNRYGLVDTPTALRGDELRQLALLVEQAAVFRTVRPHRPDAHVELAALAQQVIPP